MDNRELYSEIRELDSKLRDLRWKTEDRVWKIWWVMLVGFYLVVLLGLCSIHNAYVDAIHEMQHQIAAIQLKAPPQANLRSAP